MGLPPQTARVGLAEGVPGIIHPPSFLLLWDEQRRRAAGGTCKSFLRWRFAIIWGDGRQQDTGHGWEYKRNPFPLDGISFPRSALSW